MTTILPEKNKKEIRKVYLLGFVFKLISSLTIVLLIWIIFEFTIHSVIKLENETLNKEKNTEEFAERNTLIEGYTKLLSDSRQLIKVFKEENIRKTEILDDIFDLVPQGISVESVSVQESEDGNISVNLSGMADTRESLSEFNKILSNQEGISSVRLPASFFTKTFDIDFSLSFNFLYEKR